MPATKYQFRPAPAVWNFAEQLDHIAYGIRWWMDNYIEGKETSWDPPMAAQQKEAVMSNLEAAFGDLEATVKSANLDDQLVKGFFATTDHITHHRGQAITYLRCQGIAAPEYVF
jgi:uncharacterized damage-inducible protein DinB